VPNEQIPIIIQKTQPMSWLEGLGTVFLVMLCGSILLIAIIYLRQCYQHQNIRPRQEEIIGEQIPLQSFLQELNLGEQEQGQEQRQEELGQEQPQNQGPNQGQEQELEEVQL
jgi:hypothetical protein